jgi:hypothetical protein
MFGQSKIGSSSHIIFIYTLLQSCFVHLFLSHGAIMLSQNQFPEPNQLVFTFLQRILFTVQDQIPSTAGDASNLQPASKL